jgi:hypothetical protein
MNGKKAVSHELKTPTTKATATPTNTNTIELNSIGLALHMQ